MTKWGQIVRDLMAEKRMSQRQLSDVSGVSRSKLKRFFRGENQLRMDVLERVLHTLGYEVEIFKLDVRKR